MEDGGGKEMDLPLHVSGASAIRITNHVEIPPGESYTFSHVDFESAFRNDEKFQAWRGHIINNSLFIEEKMDRVITGILFKGNAGHANSFSSIVLAREFFTFMSKWKVLRDLLNTLDPYREKDYTQLKNDLKEIVDIRNKFAHGQVSYSGGGSGEIMLQYFSGEQKMEKITKETMEKFVQLAKGCYEGLDKLLEETKRDHPNKNK